MMHRELITANLARPDRLCSITSFIDPKFQATAVRFCNSVTKEFCRNS